MILRLAVMIALMVLPGLGASADERQKSDYLDLARRGWNYELRTTMVGRDMSIPVHINGRDLAGSTLCIVGEAPHPKTRIVLDAFQQLIDHSFGAHLEMHFAGRNATDCGDDNPVILRLYSGFPPNAALSDDLYWMNDSLSLGLPANRSFAAQSPAMAQTFFGRRGQGTHIMVQQPAHQRLSLMEAAFFKSILIEELFQSFTFGMDVLIFDRSAGFLSKLQETPMNIHRLPWNSLAFRRALLRSNPSGLCAFDVFMLHAVGRAPVDETISPSFLTYIDAQFDQLSDLAEATMADPRFAPLLDRSCRAPI